MAVQPQKCEYMVKTLHHVQQLLEESLRTLSRGVASPSTSQERELTQALRELTERLRHILSASEESPHPGSIHDNPQEEGRFPASLDFPAILTSFHLVTSKDGIIQTANDTAQELLGLDLSRLGRISLAEFIPQEEWRMISQFLGDPGARPLPRQWVVTMRTVGEYNQKMQGTILPMFARDGGVSHWVWELRPQGGESNSISLTPLNQRLISQLVAGESLEFCLSQICEGLVSTFGLSCVWVGVCEENGAITLCAHAEKAGLDWAAHGAPWWKRIAQKKLLEQVPSGVEICRVTAGLHSPEMIEWVPWAFSPQECAVMPLTYGGKSCGVFVVASDKPSFFDEGACTWLRSLRRQVMDLVGCGKRLAHMRLQSAVMDSVSYAVCVTDPHGCLQWVNEAYANLVGLPVQKILGTPLRTFPRDQIPDLKNSRRQGFVPVECLKTEVQETRPNGEVVTCEQVLTPLVDHQGIITHYVAILQDITGRKSSEAQIKHLAYHDPLTDLPNRFMFQDRLQQALAQTRRQGGLLAVLFLDLDNFKPINDRYGHRMGDRLLRVVAKRLVTCVRSTDTVARLSGDEFTVILQGLDRIRDIRQVTQKILDCLTPPIRLNGQNLLVKTSIGIAVYPKDSTRPYQLLELADQAMYRAKEQGGQRWVFATDEWNVE